MSRKPSSFFFANLRSIRLILAVFILIAALPENLWSYEGEHYGWTYYLALQVGYSKRQAYQIADATYAIDWDKNTGPMEATAGDAIFGANHTAFLGTKHPDIATIWSRFHAFKQETGNFTGVGDQVNIRRRMLDDLWKLALVERNPGPYLHLLQDSYAHSDYDTVRGHATAGHQPDFLSSDEAKAKKMTGDTLHGLSEFMKLVLKKQPKAPDMARIYEVLDELFKANPSPSLANITNFNPYGGSGAPSLPKSLVVINKAVDEDEANGRLLRFPDKTIVGDLPTRWYQYDYDTMGRVTDALYAVEKPGFEVGKESLVVTPIDDNNFKIYFTIPYKLTGLLDLKDGFGSSFLSPLPVQEKQEISDNMLDPKVRLERRSNGDHTVEMEIQRGRSELEKGVSWFVTINAYGFEPVRRELKVPLPAESAAAKDCKALITQAEQFLNAGNALEASRVFTQVKQKCGGLTTTITDLIDKTEKKLDEETDKLINQTTQSTNKCEFEEALRQAENIQQLDPGNPWLIDNLEPIRLQAEGQRRARDYLRPGMEAIQKKDIDGAISSLQQARGVTAVPQCLVDQINKLLKELELRKEFMDKTNEVQKATVNCDYKEAARLIGEITRIVPREQYITDWLTPNLKIIAELQTREKNALDLIRQADAKTGLAESEAVSVPVNNSKVALMGKEAMDLLLLADKEAPKCMPQRQQMEAIRQRISALGQRKKSQITSSIVLLIDTSGSMSANNKMEQAKEAARRAARQVSKTTEIAILNFDGGCSPTSMRVAAGFTTDLNTLLAAIETLRPGDSTPMYIATAAAVRYSQDNAQGSGKTVILMSDGGDSCRAEQAQAAAFIKASNIQVSTIGFDVGNNQQAQGDLGSLATMTGGRTFSASAADPREIIRAFNLAMLPSLLKDLDFGSVGTNLSGYFSQAKSLVQQQNISGALMMLQQANQVAPNSPNLNFNLSLLYEAEDQLIPAMNHANNYLRLAPGAVDRGDVENRIGEIQQELQKNPRVIMDSSGCRDILTWAQAEREVARRSKDAARTQAILEVMISSQRGDCDKARPLADNYKGRYR